MDLFGNIKINLYNKVMDKIKIKYYKPIINLPDYQMRICKNIPEIKWVNKVHERIEGAKIFTQLPAEEQFCLYHPKTIERQEKQNNYYETL